MSMSKGIEKVLFPAFDYKAIKESIVTDATRIQYKLNPDVQQATYNPGTIIKFDLPAHDFLDLKNTTFNFNAKAVGTSSQVCFNPFIECIIYKLTIYLGNGSDVVEQLLNYQLDASSTFKFGTSLNYGTTIGRELQGYLKSVDRIDLAVNEDENFNAQGTRYVVNFLASGLFNGSNLRYLPMGPLAQINGYNRSLHIEIELSQPQFCMQDFAANPQPSGKNYVLSEVYMNLEIVKAPSYESKLISEIQNGRVIAIPLISTDVEPNEISNGRASNITFPIFKQRQWVTGVKSLFIPPYSNPATAFTWDWGRPENLQNYQYQVAAKLWPPEPVKISGLDNDANRFGELMKYFNKLKDYKNGTLVSEDFEFSDSPNATEILCDTITPNPTTITDTAVHMLNFTSPQVGHPYYLNTGSFTFQVANSGEYNINLRFGGQRDATGATTNAVLQYGLYDFTNAAFIADCNSTETYDSTGAGDGPEEDLVIVFDGVLLESGFNYGFAVQFTSLGSGVNARFACDTAVCQVEADDNLVIYDVRDFCIGQTFKTFYDQDEYQFGDYILDGISTMQSSMTTLNMDLGQTSTQFSVYQFINYMKMIIIDKDGVKVFS